MRNYTSVITQMLQMISRYDFQKAVKQHGSESHSKGLSEWNHFISILFGQFSGKDGLRGIEAGMVIHRRNMST